MEKSEAVVILGDQLTTGLASLKATSPQRARVFMAEIREETHYVRHSKHKLVFILSAMRHFADELTQQGWQVDYHSYSAERPQQSFAELLSFYCSEHNINQIHVTQCGEWRLQQQINSWCRQLDIPVHQYEDSRFICRQEEFRQWATGRKQLRMEYFYRAMRRQTGMLMEGDKPIGGKWNYDAANRKKYDCKKAIPERSSPGLDDITHSVLKMVEQEFTDNPGDLSRFWVPVTRSDAEQWFDEFILCALPGFGDYEDAMVEDQPFLFHSLLSPLLNIGLLDPLNVCRRAEQAYHQGIAPLNAVEGFIRQILGWREYIRGIYWLWMPDYADLNELNAHNTLPDMFWSGNTRMRCLSQALNQTLDLGYAHHIQRLMVIGNWALLLGLEPRQVCDWYLAVYIDAFDWVELPNTLGMALHGDGGRLASKPYAASGKYIQRMSNHCKQCPYSVSRASEDDACPYNSLYWHFMQHHRERLAKNPRVAVLYRGFDNKTGEEQEAILKRAEYIIQYPDQF